MRIAITGASGSLGRAIISRLVTEGGADRIVAFSRVEQHRAALIRDFGHSPGFRCMAGDVRDRDRLTDIFWDCEVVIHGAARKVVSAHPDEAEELLKTNVLGTMNVIDAAHEAGVDKLVVVSSDKAVHAENVYGVSKAMAEHLAVNANAKVWPRGMRIGCVRYGNVIGSTGSVIPLWRRAIAMGQPIDISSSTMTRFWITLPQAVDLILTAVANLRGGEIVVPRLPAADIETLANAVMAEYGNTTVRNTGVRQGGEKFHEELLSAAEIARTRLRNDVFVVAPYQNDEMWDAKPWVGALVPQDMVYRSDVWSPRLDVAQMRALLNSAA